MIQELREEQEMSCANPVRVSELMLALRKTIPSLRNWVDCKGNFYPPVDQLAPPLSSHAETRMPITDPLLATVPKRSKKQFRTPGQLETLENADASNDFTIPNAPDDLSITDANKIIQAALGQLTRQQEILSQEICNLIIVSISMHYITSYVSDSGKQDQAICDLIKQAHFLVGMA